MPTRCATRSPRASFARPSGGASARRRRRSGSGPAGPRRARRRGRRRSSLQHLVWACALRNSRQVGSNSCGAKARWGREGQGGGAGWGRGQDHPEQVGLPAGGGKRRVPGCAARRSRSWPGSAPTGTSGWRRATSTVFPTTSSTPSHAPCISTRPNGRTCSTSPAPQDPPVRRGGRTAQVQPQPAADRRVHGHQARVRAQRAPGPARGQRTRACPVRRGVRRPVRPANLARFSFLDPRARDFYPDWDWSVWRAGGNSTPCM
jgi:hypothetical protein